MLYPKLKVLEFCLAWQTVVLRTRLKGCILSNPSNTRGQREDWLQMPKDAHNLKGNLMLLRLLSCQAVENVNWRCNYLDDLSLTRLQLYCSNLFLCFCPPLPTRMSAPWSFCVLMYPLCLNKVWPRVDTQQMFATWMNAVTVCSRSLEHKLRSLKVPGYQERAFIFLLYTFESYLCILDRRPLSDMCSANIFCALSFHSLIVPFKELNYLILTKSTLFGFPMACALGVIPKIIFAQAIVTFSPLISSRSF